MADDKEKPEEVIFTDSAESWFDADYQLMSREVTSVDKIVYGVVRQRAFAQKLFPSVKIPKGVKTHSLVIEVEQEAPLFDDNFNREALDEVRKTESSFYPVFMHKDYWLNQTDIDASRQQKFYNTNLLELTVRGTTGTIADYKEKVIWRGYNISGRAHAAANRQGLIDTSSKGIMDTTNVQTFDVGAGADSSLTAAGDASASVGFAMADLIPYDYYGPYDFILSPKVYKQFIQMANSTTNITDLERLQTMVDIKGSKILRNLDVTKYLLGTAETTSTAACLFFDRKTPAGEPTCVIGEEYPIAHLPMKRPMYGVGGKVIWSGIPIVLRPYAFTKDEAITTD